jgi:hypothetical protein
MFDEIARTASHTSAYIILSSFTDPKTNEYLREIALVVKYSDSNEIIVDHNINKNSDPEATSSPQQVNMENSTNSDNQLFDIISSAIENSALDVERISDSFLTSPLQPAYRSRYWVQRNLSKGRKYVAPLVVDTLSKL